MYIHIYIFQKSLFQYLEQLFAKRDAESLEGAWGWGKEGWGLSRRKRAEAERAISRGV